MNKVSTNRRAKVKTAKSLYCDSFGVPFSEANRVALKIPFVMKDIKRPEVLRFMHEQSGEDDIDFDLGDRQTFGICWICEEQRLLQLHHVVSRWDFYGNCLMCCREDHECIHHNPDALPEVLRALVTHNPFVSWLHLIKARGSYFPFTDLD